MAMAMAKAKAKAKMSKAKTITDTGTHFNPLILPRESQILITILIETWRKAAMMPLLDLLLDHLDHHLDDHGTNKR